MRSATAWSNKSVQHAWAAGDRSTRSISPTPWIYTVGIASRLSSFPGKYVPGPALRNKNESEYPDPAHIIFRASPSPRQRAHRNRAEPLVIGWKVKPVPQIPSIPSSAFERSRGGCARPPDAALPYARNPLNNGHPAIPRCESRPERSSGSLGHGLPPLADRYFEKAAHGRNPRRRNTPSLPIPDSRP